MIPTLLAAVVAISASDIDSLIRKLGSSDFQERNAAADDLRAIGRAALPALRDAVRNTTDPEVKRRAEAAINAIELSPCKETYNLRGHKSSVTCLSFSRDGKYLVTGGEDEIVLVWNLVRGTQQLCFRRHSGAITSVAFGPNGRTVFSESALDKTACLWRVEDMSEVWCIRDRNRYVFCGPAFLPDDSRLLLGGRDASLVNARTGKEILKFGRHYSNWVCAVAISSDGKLALSSGEREGDVYVWDTKSAQQVYCLSGHRRNAREAAFSPTNREVLTLGDQGDVRLWELVQGVERAREVKGLHLGRGVRATIGYSGSEPLLMYLDEADLIVQHIKSDRSYRRLRQPDPIECLAISPDGNLAATGGADGTVRVWNLCD